MNAIYMVAINHNKSEYQHSDFADYSKRTWEYWCEKNGVDFHCVTKHDDRYGYPIWNKLNVTDICEDYEKVGIVDCDTMIRWNAPNIFDTMGEGIHGVRDTSNLRWVYDSLNAYGSEFFPKFQLEIQKYINAGVVFLDKKSLKVYDKVREFYFENQETLDNWSKGGGREQTIFNYIAQINGFNIRLISPTWNLVGMHKTELFSMNWQKYSNEIPYGTINDFFKFLKDNNEQPFYTKYGNIYHFTGFPIEQREEIMRQTWELTKKYYE